MSDRRARLGPRARPERRRGGARRLVAFAAAVVASYLLVALLVAGGVLAEAPDARVGEKLLGPGPGHWLGTDRQGRDVLARAIHATKPAVLVGLASALVATAGGALLGVLAGWRRGGLDHGALWLAATAQSIPRILLLAALAHAAGRGTLGVCVAFFATLWTGPFRLARAEALRLREAPWIEAARALGASDRRVIARHLLPHTLPVVWPSGVSAFIEAVKSEAILSYLGLGVLGAPSWGTMIHQASVELVNGAWWMLAAPTAAMAALVLALSILSNALGEAQDPRGTGGRPRQPQASDPGGTP